MNQKRHSRDCRICRHPEREEIERQFISWESASTIAKAYRLSRASIYRHALALGLIAIRQKNIAGALANFIERCARVRPSAAAFVSACIALSKINAEGQTVDRMVSTSDSLDEFDNFTRAELQTFISTGGLPPWYKGKLSGTPNRSNETLQ